MSEVRKCIRQLMLYGLFFALIIPFETNIIPNSGLTRYFSSMYLIFLSLWLIQRNSQRVAGDKHLKDAMHFLAIMIFLLFLLRGLKYSVFGNVSILGRCTWYLYYLPMLCIPVLLLIVSLYVYARDEKRIRKIERWAAALTALFVFFVLTNDLHQQVFRFQPGFIGWDSDYEYGWGFILVLVGQYLFYFAAILVLVVKCSISKIKYRAFLVLIPFVTGIILLILLMTKNMPKINGKNITELPEVLCFMVTGVLECCMQLGMIPTNESYRDLIKVTSLPVQITDYEGNVVYKSAAAGNLTHQQLSMPDNARMDAHNVLRRMEIPGGYGFWQEDMTELDRLNEELEEARERLAEETELSRLQNELVKKKAAIEQRSMLYDTIAQRTHRQSRTLSRLAAQACETRDEALIDHNRRYITFLGAYVKRYANLMLLSEDSRTLDSGELALSFSEVLRYLNLFGTSVEVLNRANGPVSAAQALEVFEAFQMILEKNLTDLSGVTANFFHKEEKIVIRLTLEGLRKSLPQEKRRKLTSDGVTVEIYEEDDITYLSFLLRKGGTAV